MATTQQPPLPSPSPSSWAARVGAAWRAHALVLELQAIEAAGQERLRHVPPSAPHASREAIRQRTGKGLEDARARHSFEAAADANEARRAAAQQRARLRRLARAAAEREKATAVSVSVADRHVDARCRAPPKRTLSEETRRARGLLGLGLVLPGDEAPAAGREEGGEDGRMEGQVARALLSSSPATVESVLAARPLLLSTTSTGTTTTNSSISSPVPPKASGNGGLMDALLQWGPGPHARRRREAAAAVTREAARRRWRRLQEGRPLVAFFAPMFDGGGSDDLSSSSIGSGSSSTEWADPAWEENFLSALGPAPLAAPPSSPPSSQRVGSPSGQQEPATAPALLPAAATAIIVPYLEALLRLPPPLRQQRAPAPAQGSPIRHNPSSHSSSASITATVLDRHHRRHPLGQATLRFLLYLEHAYGPNQEEEEGGEEEEEGGDGGLLDFPLLLDAMATDVARFLTYLEAGLRLMWPRVGATRPDALPLLRRALHHAAFTLLAPPMLATCQHAHAETEARLLARLAALRTGEKGGLAGGLGVPPRYRLEGSGSEEEREARAYAAYRPAIAAILRVAALPTPALKDETGRAPSGAGVEGQGEGEEEQGEPWVQAKARHLRRALHEICGCIDRHHKAAAAAARASPTPPPPSQPRFLPPGSPAEEAAAQDGMGPAATLFMASDELLPVVEYGIALAYHPPSSSSSSCSSSSSGLPPLRHLAAHLEVLDRFHYDEDSKRGEAGFALCSFQAAVADLVMVEGQRESEEGEEVLLRRSLGRGVVGTVQEEEEGVFEDAVEA